MNKNVDVVIVGAGITGLTTAFYLIRSGLKVLVVERSARCGGMIKTIKNEDFIYELGPNTGTLGSVEVVQLFDDLGDKVKLEVANSKAKYRWIWKKGKWHVLPSGFFSAVSTPLFTWKDKLNILGEPFRKPGTEKNETLADLVRRRMGKSFLDYAVDPFISGIYSGDPEKLVTRFALPKLYHLEQNYGSFVRGAIKKRKEPKTEIEKRVTKEVFSVEGGFGNLIKALEISIGKENIINSCTEVKIDRVNEKYITKYTDIQGKQQQIDSKFIISTIGSSGIKNAFSFLTDEEKTAITNIEYTKVVQAVICYKKWEGKPLKAFGGLMPSKEKRNILGVLFPSAFFKNRAPKEGAVISMFMGGSRHAEMIEKSNEEIEAIVMKEVVETLETDKKPDIMEILRFQNAIAQYEKSSENRLEAIKNAQQKYSHLYIAGSLCGGIGIADRVKQARLIAEEIIALNS